MAAMPLAINVDRFAFAPDADRAAALDDEVRAGLADSLATIFDSLGGDLPIAPARRAALLGEIRSAPLQPRAFGLYVELVLALFGEREDDAGALLDVLAVAPLAAGPGLRVVTLDDGELGPGESARYRRLIADDVPFQIEAAPPARRAAADALVAEAFGLLDAGAPDLAAEVRALVREVVLVTGQTETEGQVLGGASAFALWGAVFQNIDQRIDRLGMALSLTHEAAHLHLFGLAGGGRVALNDDEERFASPLRRDPRPMEGIVHAAYVVARMAYALRAFLDRGVLTAAEETAALRLLADNCAAFADGERLALAHARFTPAGAAAFADAAKYMHAAVGQGSREAPLVAPS